MMFIPAQSMTKFLALKREETLMRREAERVCRESKVKLNFRSRIEFDEKKRDFRLVARTSSNEKFEEVNMKQNGRSCPLINLSEVTSYDNHKGRSNRYEQPTLKPDLKAQTLIYTTITAADR